MIRHTFPNLRIHNRLNFSAMPKRLFLATKHPQALPDDFYAILASQSKSKKKENLCF
jgi:hypothetical protein